MDADQDQLERRLHGLLAELELLEKAAFRSPDIFLPEVMDVVLSELRGDIAGIVSILTRNRADSLRNNDVGV